MKIVQEVKETPFKPLKRRFYFGKISYGVPYFWPMGFNSTIFSIRKLQERTPEEIEEHLKQWQYTKGNDLKFKNMPMVRRSKYFIVKLLGSYWYIKIGWPIAICKTELGWKDKYSAPRFEFNPSFIIFFFKWQFVIIYEPDTKNEDTYWEMYLWWKNYCGKDMAKAESTWSWIDYDTKITTWNKNFLK